MTLLFEKVYVHVMLFSVLFSFSTEPQYSDPVGRHSRCGFFS